MTTLLSSSEIYMVLGTFCIMHQNDYNLNFLTHQIVIVSVIFAKLFLLDFRDAIQ